MRQWMGRLALAISFGTAAAAAWADTHAILSSSRLYMDQERKIEGEVWIAPGRSWAKTGSRILIIREDLGVMWSVDPGRAAYREIALKEVERAPADAPADMRKLWLSYYLPDYDWTIKETGESKEINGFQCRGYEARGEADFAEIKAAYWVCESRKIPGGRAWRDYTLAQIKGDRERAGQARILTERPGVFPVAFEETIEHSIAPAMVRKTALVKLEEGPAPAGIYDLPAGLKKSDR